MKTNTQVYMDEIRKSTVLAIDEENKLFAEYRENGSRKAFNKILSSNTKFVLKIAFKYNKATRYDLGDLIGAGNLGMMQAMETYEYGKPGMRFTQWAVFKIRANMLTEIAAQNGFLTIHGNEANLNQKLRKAEETLRQSLGRTPTVKEIAAVTKLKESHIKHMQNVLTTQKSMDAPVGQDEASLHDTLKASNHEDDDNKHLINTMAKLMERSSLDELHKDVVRMYFGIGYPESYSLGEISEKHSRSREGIRVIKKRALDKLIEFSLDQKVNSELHLTMELLAC